MTVWLVTRGWYDEDTMKDVYHNIGIFTTEEKAKEAKRIAEEYMENLVDEGGEKIEFIDADVWIDEFEIDKLDEFEVKRKEKNTWQALTE